MRASLKTGSLHRLFHSSYVTFSRDSFAAEAKLFPKSDLDVDERNENSQQVEQSQKSGSSEFVSEMRIIEHSNSNQEQEVQFADLKLEHEDFMTFREQSSPGDNQRRLTTESVVNPEEPGKSQNLLEGLKELQHELTEKARKELRIKARLMALYQGYIVRKTMKNNAEIR